MTHRARNGEPQPAHIPYPAQNTEQKRDLKSWWKNFSRGNQKRANAPQGIFGVPLIISVRYANVAISLQDAEGKSYVYGYVPIVVAKCGVFLKEKATDVEGIFRLSGSEKRIKELREAFNSPDRYGKGLDWTGYTVHDAANILRRYFNQLPEPIIPLNCYEKFRIPLRGHQSQAVGQMEGQAPSYGDFDPEKTIKVFQNLITELPPLNRQLLLYILDLLAVFASKSDLNKMTTPNLAAIFQPGILSHPNHDMAPPEYRLSQDVLIFLIENQDHFLIGMQGTAADDKTKEEVESGPPTPSASKSPNMFGRSSSGASRLSGMRRSVSVSSRNSRSSIAAPIPAAPVMHSNSPLATPTGGGGVHRSNTVPTNHSPRGSHSRFQRDLVHQDSTPEVPSPSSPMPMHTPMGDMPGAFPTGSFPGMIEAPKATNMVTPASPSVIPPSEQSTPLASPPITHYANDSMTQLFQHGYEPVTPKQHILVDPGMSSAYERQETPSPGAGGPKTFAAIFGGKSPPSDAKDQERKPRKLQKKRIPGSANPSAQSSQHSLNDSIANTDRDSLMPVLTTVASTLSSPPLNAQDHSTPMQQQLTFIHGTSSVESTPLQPPPNMGLKADPPMSPANSYRSHSEFTEGELDDVPALDEPTATVLPGQGGFGEMEPADGKKKPFWRRKKGESMSYGQGQIFNPEAERSRVSVISGDGRKSLSMDRALGSMSDPESFNESKDGSHSSWLGRKLAERAEKREQRDRMREENRIRAKSPPPPLYLPGQIRAGGASMLSLAAATAEGGQSSPSIPTPVKSGKSIDVRRDDRPRSFDAGHEQLSVIASSTPKRSTDAGPKERKSLLELGEEHAASQRQEQAVTFQRTIDATAAATAALSPHAAPTAQKDFGASSAAAAAFASASAAGKGDSR
ncbi:hypothetical protein BLS_002102 [Venturia inaequalis]|uniref:Rho-GAP domain-containing protein n=1 Tax=Venturia inaequalis TaxID=5025 RepID=A0A8H3UVQ2_VENIN|nr:hypothetical protein BLS_002102 [Venturia inaequalis]